MYKQADCFSVLIYFWVYTEVINEMIIIAIVMPTS